MLGLGLGILGGRFPARDYVLQAQASEGSGFIRFWARFLCLGGFLELRSWLSGFTEVRCLGGVYDLLVSS